MSKQILVCLPLREEQKRAMQQAAPEAEFRFTVPADVTAEDVRWADAVLGNVPVELIRQNESLEWFQSNTAGPDAYLAPGVLPERCHRGLRPCHQRVDAGHVAGAAEGSLPLP